MIEKVNPKHPDKVADRIAGAIVDLAYHEDRNSRVAIEVLIGHGVCNVIIETNVTLDKKAIHKAVERIAGNVRLDLVIANQDEYLQKNQHDKVRCGDNGIFKGVPLTEEEKNMSRIARNLYERYDSDGKYILDGERLIICQSKAEHGELAEEYPDATINPLGYWTGGTSVDTGATNRKLGSDMAQSVTGGGLHGKDLSKADVSVNIYAFLKAQETNETIEFSCAIGDEHIDGKPFEEIVEIAEQYINDLGGFERLAEWGLF